MGLVTLPFPPCFNLTPLATIASMSRAYSPSFQSLHLPHSSFSFSKLSVTSPTSQLILQPFPRFTYVTTHSPTLPLLHLRHSSFSNPSFASPTSQDFHLSYLANRPCLGNRKGGDVQLQIARLYYFKHFEIRFITELCLY